MKVTLGNQIRAVEREIALRRDVYARRVSGGKMKRSHADWEIEAMEAVLETLRCVEEVQDEFRALLIAKRKTQREAAT